MNYSPVELHLETNVDMDQYVLRECTEDRSGCDVCKLNAVCDRIADDLDDINFMLCANDEMHDEFENPYYDYASDAIL